MAKAVDVAAFLVRLADTEDEPDRLTQMRLQKLLYYAQGHSFAERGGPLFPEDFEAWVHGPVIRTLHRSLRSFGANSIDPESFPTSGRRLTSEEAQFVARVWESYKGFSATQLRRMTHEESPWQEARSGLPADAICDAVISKDALRKYFAARATRAS